MKHRTAVRLAWTFWILTVTLTAVGLFLTQLNGSAAFLDAAFGTLVGLAYAVVGLLLASRRPENLIGWVVSAGALLSAAGPVAIEYGIYGLVTAPGSVPLAVWVAMFGGVFRSIGFMLTLYVVLLLFPDGHLPSPRWWGVTWMLVASAVVQALDMFFGPDFSDISSRFSPFTKPTAGILPDVIARGFGGLTILFWVASVFACVAAIVVRFRRSRGDERQQLKWLTYSSFFSGAIALLIYVCAVLNLDILNYLGGFLFNLLLAPIPIAVGIAVLKYRLYDIDIIINRTLVYGSLTAILALVYWGSVVGLQALLRPLVGEGNDLAVVVSTLIIAGLFLPLHRAIQRFIDRRFYRRKYDAARTLQAFTATLRDEVDLEMLADRLVDVVEDTMQPAMVSLWLRKPEKEARR